MTDREPIPEEALPEEILRLGPILDLKAASGLKAALLRHRGRPLAVDASEVEQLGSQCLQVLAAARKSWQADGVALRIGATSPEFDRGLTLIGGTKTAFSTDRGPTP